MSNDLTQREPGQVPEWMRRNSTGASFGNVDASDMKPPRLKILAGQSPEVTDGKPNAVPGNFWMTIIEKNLGPSVVGTPLILRKSYHLWAPRGGIGSAEQKGPLATASDGIHWDTPNQAFEVRFQGNPKVYKWRIGRLVTDYRMHKFGSSQDDNPKSKPAATLTYDMLWSIGGQLCMFTSSRTGVTPTQNFISACMLQGVDQYFQRWRMNVQRRTGPTGDPYFGFEYTFEGLLTSEEEGDRMKRLYEQYRNMGFAADMEAEAEEINEARREEGQTPYQDRPHHVDKEDIPF